MANDEPQAAESEGGPVAPPPAPGQSGNPVPIDDLIPIAPPAPPAGPAPEDMGPVAPAGPAPGGIYPSAPDQPAASGRGSSVARVGVLTLFASAAVALGGLLVKFGLPILIGSAAAGVFDGVFGGPFEKIPEAQQQVLEQRAEAAFGDTLDGMSEEQATARVGQALNAGLPRLADEDLVDRLMLSGDILEATDVATCAEIARSTTTGRPADDAMSRALGSLPPDDIGRWFDINVTAIEAELAGAPPVRSPDIPEVDRITMDLVAMLDEQELAMVQALYGGDGATATDEDACGGVRALYRGMGTLPPADARVMALYDVAP